jgi:predicted ATPase
MAFDRERHTTHPFNLPLVQGLPSIEFAAPVTFFVGENGSGKSTLLEALACAIGSITVGSANVKTDPTLAHARELAKHLRLSWSKKTNKGLFLRAEDYFGYVKNLAQLRQQLAEDEHRVDADLAGSSQYARDLARGVFRGQAHAIDSRYQKGLDERSHGESFIDFFRARFVAGGVYLLDEPEAPLSPLRQIGMLALLKQLVAQGAQFIIATHSPILMAYPQATILQFGGSGSGHEAIKPVDYNAVEHVAVTRDFLKNPERFLRHLEETADG